MVVIEDENGGLETPENAQTVSGNQADNPLLDFVKEWPEIGDTYNEERGVDHVHAKKINGEWAYVQLEWRYGTADVGFIFYGGKRLDLLTDLAEMSDKPARTHTKSATTKENKTNEPQDS